MFEKSQQKQNNYATNKEFSDIKLPSNEKVTKTDPMMNQFLSVVEKLSAEKERETGNGRLDMSELVTALQNFQEPSLIKSSQQNLQNYNHSSTFSDKDDTVPHEQNSRNVVTSHLEIKVGLSVRQKICCAAAPDVMKTMQNILVYQDEQKAHKQRLR